MNIRRIKKGKVYEAVLLPGTNTFKIKVVNITNENVLITVQNRVNQNKFNTTLVLMSSIKFIRVCEFD
jgi:hypothetical protein